MAGVLGIAAAPFVAALKGFTLATMWRWFIVPQFHAPELGVLSAIGLFLTVDIVMQRYRQPKEDEDDHVRDVIQRIAFVVIVCGLTLAEGWIVMSLMG